MTPDREDERLGSRPAGDSRAGGSLYEPDDSVPALVVETLTALRRRVGAELETAAKPAESEDWPDLNWFTAQR